MSRARDFADLASSSSNISTVAADSANLDQVASSYSAGGITGKNLIINGGQSISQRGTSISVTTDSIYNADRFLTRTYGGNGTYTVSTLQTDIPTVGDLYYSTKYAVNSAATDTGTYGYAIEQRIEGYSVSHLRLGRADAKQITLSFWVKSSVAGTYTGAIRTTSGEYSYVFEYTLSANTWTKVEKTISALTGVTLSLLDETNGIALFVSPINFGAQTSKSTATTDTWISGNYVFTSNQVDWMGTAGATCYITGIQLEVGEQATPFEHRSYGDELARCQRYYYQTTYRGAADTTLLSGTVASGTTAAQCGDSFPVTMRSAPAVGYSGSITAYDGSQNNTVTAITANGSSTTNATINVTAGTGLTTGRAVQILSNASNEYLTFDAEL